MKGFEILSQTMNVLREDGSVEDFNLKLHSLECRNGKHLLMNLK